MKIGGASGPTNLGLMSSRLVRKRVSKTRWTTSYKQHQIVPRPSHTYTPYSSGIHSHRHSCPHTYAHSYTQTRMHYYMHYYIHHASTHVHMNIYVRTHFRKKKRHAGFFFFLISLQSRITVLRTTNNSLERLKDAVHYNRNQN